MRTVTQDNFGLLIAYILPGFLAVLAVSLFADDVRLWVGAGAKSEVTVGGFLYVTLASAGLGLLVSTVRWLIVDAIHYRTGIPRRNWDYGQLGKNLAGFEFLVANQYRYYQFYANSFVGVAFLAVAWMLKHGTPTVVATGAVLAAEVTLWLGSRDTLRNYHKRVEELLGRNKAAPRNSDQKPILKITPGVVGSSHDSGDSRIVCLRRNAGRKPQHDLTV